MKQFFTTVAGVFVGLVLFFIIVPVFFFGLLISSISAQAQRAPKAGSEVLELDLRQGLTDQDTFALFGSKKLSVMKIITTLRHAEKDDRVKSLLVRLPETGMAPAEADELRLAFIHFRASGKPVLAHSQGLYPEGMVASTYEVGAASGELWMQGESAFQVVGAATSELFLKRFFDQHQIKAEFEQRYEYKNAVNPFLYSGYTPAHKEATLSWMGSVFDTALQAVATDRKTDPGKLKALIVAGPYSAPDAKAKGLIDKVGGVREAEDDLKARAGDDAKIVDFADYAVEQPRTTSGSGPRIAVIEAEGDIVTGRGKESAFSNEVGIFSDDTAKAFYEAIEDKSVQAIVFRVSSPGGVDTASEQILQAVKAARAAGKPVVVSMGTYAASGGYWISSQADWIVSEPSTLTGSIGVFGGKFALGPALAKYGLDMDDLTVGGDYAGAFTATKGFTPAQRATFAAWLNQTYDAFIQRVSEGRKIPAEQVREIAKGRVWTGVLAKEHRLVDQLGGFYDAVEKAKALAHIPADQEVQLKRFPGPKGFFKELGEALGMSESSARTLAAAGWVLGDPRARETMDRIAEARLRSDGHSGVVLAPTELPRR
jgi:protease-4